MTIVSIGKAMFYIIKQVLNESPGWNIVVVEFGRSGNEGDRIFGYLSRVCTGRRPPRHHKRLTCFLYGSFRVQPHANMGSGLVNYIAEDPLHWYIFRLTRIVYWRLYPCIGAC